MPKLTKHQLTTRKSFTRQELIDYFEHIVFGRLVTGKTPVVRMVVIERDGYKRYGFGIDDSMTLNAFNALVFPNNVNINYVVQIDLSSMGDLKVIEAREGILHILKHCRVLQIRNATPYSLGMLFSHLGEL